MSAALHRDAWADAVFDAVAVLRAHMADPTSTHALTAAVEIIEIESTRMRHGRAVSGTTAPATDTFEFADDLPPVTRLLPVPPDADPDEVEDVRQDERELLAEMM